MPPTDRTSSVITEQLRRALGEAVHNELAGAEIKSKQRVRPDGSTYGGQKIARGALYLMLQNRIYQGEITHKRIQARPYDGKRQKT